MDIDTDTDKHTDTDTDIDINDTTGSTDEMKAIIT